MLEHQPPAVGGLVVLTVPPIGIMSLVLPAAATLLPMKVIPFVVDVHGAATPVTPDDVEGGRWQVLNILCYRASA